MLKRILAVVCGILLGSVLTVTVPHFAAGWGFWPNRELDKSSRYMREVLSLINQHYVFAQEAEYTKLTQAALRGMTSALDPHSEFMDAKASRALEEEMTSEFGGIGIQVELRRGRVVVVAPLPDSPGARAGIQRGDEIIRIEGQPVGTPVLEQVVGRLRGPLHTTVSLSVYRPATRTELDFKVEREAIKVQSVRRVQVLPGDIGYVQITQFTEHTGEEFVNALNRLSDKNIRALVIDLRDNPGGLLDAAVTVAEPFFRKGELIVYTQGRRPEDRENYFAEAPEDPLTLPTAVLINAGSASAAEIVAGALKDTRRAVIVGERSFGKGSVQTIFPLQKGESLRLTTARYYTPGGITLHERGVTPDVEVTLTAEEDQRLGQQRADPEGDFTLDEATETNGAAPTDANDPTTPPTPTPATADRQLDAALAVLRAALLLDPDQLLTPSATSAPTAAAPSLAPASATAATAAASATAATLYVPAAR